MDDVLLMSGLDGVADTRKELEAVGDAEIRGTGIDSDRLCAGDVLHREERDGALLVRVLVGVDDMGDAAVPQ